MWLYFWLFGGYYLRNSPVTKYNICSWSSTSKFSLSTEGDHRGMIQKCPFSLCSLVTTLSLRESNEIETAGIAPSRNCSWSIIKRPSGKGLVVWLSAPTCWINYTSRTKSLIHYEQKCSCLGKISARFTTAGVSLTLNVPHRMQYHAGCNTWTWPSWQLHRFAQRE